MKTIGTCNQCKWWKGEQGDDSGSCGHAALGAEDDGTFEQHYKLDVFAYDDSYPLGVKATFGCIHWEDKTPPLDSYPTKSAADLLIEDLQRENDAAFERIQALSRALVDLGYDPTQLP